MCCQNYETLKEAILALLKWSDDEIKYHLTKEGFEYLQKHKGYDPSYKKDILSIKTALNIIQKEVKNG